MRREPIVSSTIAAIGFEATSEILDIEFVNGRVYRYFDVSERVYEELKVAASPGRYVNTILKEGDYRYIELR